VSRVASQRLAAARVKWSWGERRTRSLPSPLRGGSARRAGVGVVPRRTEVASHHDPHPQPLPARGRGADRARGVIVHQQKKKLPYPGLFATPASAKVAIPV
jgi:hypothetical protein